MKINHQKKWLPKNSNLNIIGKYFFDSSNKLSYFEGLEIISPTELFIESSLKIRWKKESLIGEFFLLK